VLILNTIWFNFIKYKYKSTKYSSQKDKDCETGFKDSIIYYIITLSVISYTTLHAVWKRSTLKNKDKHFLK
jgi:hypothetical protein